MLKIAIDLDDTITDTSIYLTKYLAEFFNMDIDYLINNEIYYIKLPEKLASKREEFERYAFRECLFDIPIKENAKKIINKLKKEGNKIIIITARDNTTFNNPFEQTKKQLDNLGVKYDKIICTRNKTKACKKEKIDVIIDDSMTNLNDVNNYVKTKILFTSNYNKKFNVPFIRANNWNEIYQLLNGELYEKTSIFNRK